MKIEVNVEKKHLYLIAFLAVVIMAVVVIAPGATQGHPVSEITGTGTMANTLTITAGQKVGIGITDPNEKLEVNGKIKASDGFCWGSDCKAKPYSCHWEDGGDTATSCSTGQCQFKGAVGCDPSLASCDGGGGIHGCGKKAAGDWLYCCEG